MRTVRRPAATSFELGMTIDTAGWSGDGDFTAALLEALKGLEGVAFVKVEDAPASRAEAGYNFLANEVYVGFRLRRVPGTRRLGILRVPWIAVHPDMNLHDLDRALSSLPGIGPPDYADEGMLQYLRTERIVPPYQTRGYKQVEMVRIYEAKPAGRSR